MTNDEIKCALVLLGFREAEVEVYISQALGRMNRGDTDVYFYLNETCVITGYDDMPKFVRKKVQLEDVLTVLQNMGEL